MRFLNKIKSLAFAIVLFFSISTIYSQVNKNVGTRITDVSTEKELRTNAILDLESTSKGFFLPRMTTIQRDAIKKEMGKDNGLAVYNIDNDCVEYWSERAGKWMSLCGSLPPAKLDLADDSCDNIVFNGFDKGTAQKPLLVQGEALSPEKHQMTISLKVQEVGTYSISANSNNGYFFTGEGQFQAIGTYYITLKGMGTPIKGYDQTGTVKGDKLLFSINGIDSKVCSNTEVLVEPAPLDFIIQKADYKAMGTYFVGKAASIKEGNKIELAIDVKSGGLATVTAENKALKMKFVGTKQLTVTDKVLVLEPMQSNAIPDENTLSEYPFSFDVNTIDPVKTINLSKANLVVEETKIEPFYDKAIFSKEPFYQGGTLNENHTIEVPIKVLASGKRTLILKDGEVEFMAKEVMLTMPNTVDQLQIVKFIAVKGRRLPEVNAVDLKLSSTSGRFVEVGTKTLKLVLDKKPVAYTIVCNSIKGNRGSIAHNRPIGDSYFITAKVNVTEPGEYELRTSAPVEGIVFSTNINGVKQKFDEVGQDIEVTLYPIDKNIIPVNRGEYTVRIEAKDLSNASCSNVKIKVGYGDIKVLLIKQNSTSNANDELFFMGKNADGRSRFGYDGAFVETGDVSVTSFDANVLKTAKDRADLARDIRDKKYNFILTVGQFGILYIDKGIADALYDYTINNDGIFYMLTTYFDAAWGSKEPNYVEGVSRFVGSTPNRFVDGINLVKRFNDNQDIGKWNVTVNMDYNMTVKDMVNEPLTKPRFGYEYNYITGTKKYRNISTGCIKPPSAFYDNLSIQAEKSKYRPLVSDRGNANNSLVFVHKEYKNLIWSVNATTSYPSLFVNQITINKDNGEPFKQDSNRSNEHRDYAPFVTNMVIELVSQLANR